MKATPAGRVTPPWDVVMSKGEVNNSDGKASLKQQKSPKTTTDTRDASKFYWFYA